MLVEPGFFSDRLPAARREAGPRVPSSTTFHRPVVETWDYPKAGDANPIVRLGVAALASAGVRWIDTAAYGDFLIVNVEWTPDSRSVVYQAQNRIQTWLELNFRGPSHRRDEDDPEEVRRRPGVEETGNPVWLKMGRFSG